MGESGKTYIRTGEMRSVCCGSGDKRIGWAFFCSCLDGEGSTQGSLDEKLSVGCWSLCHVPVRNCPPLAAKIYQKSGTQAATDDVEQRGNWQFLRKAECPTTSTEFLCRKDQNHLLNVFSNCFRNGCFTQFGDSHYVGRKGKTSKLDAL